MNNPSLQNGLGKLLYFTKMQGAGNDFVVIDGIGQQVALDATQWRWLADRRYGVGADQILLVEAAQSPDVDFNYRIFNADGGEVEHCGNGARCFAVFVRDQGLSNKSEVKVQIKTGVITLKILPSGEVTVNMGAPRLGAHAVGFDTQTLASEKSGQLTLWTLPATEQVPQTSYHETRLALVSMGNPHAVQLVTDVLCAPVLTQGPVIEKHKRFAHGVNAGYIQLENRHQAKVRVYERGSGETLACGTGICAAAVAVMAQGLADSPLEVKATGGTLNIAWDFNGPLGLNAPVYMTGPATRVFSGSVEVPHLNIKSI
jgi:diaminopimelate epimerase